MISWCHGIALRIYFLVKKRNNTFERMSDVDLPALAARERGEWKETYFKPIDRFYKDTKLLSSAVNMLKKYLTESRYQDTMYP